MSAHVRLVGFVVVVAVAFAVVLVAGVPRSPQALRAAMLGFGVVAPLVFAGMWVLVTPAMFSGTLLAAGAGLVFGIWTGFAVGLLGATLGGVAAFLIARRLGHGAVQQLLGARLRSIQERIERRGLLAVIVARAAPGVPTTALNYACGLSRVRLRHFALGSAIGGAPRIFAYTALGGSGGSLDSPAALAALGLIAAMTAAGLAVALRARRRARRAPAAAPPPL
jgi:uncharacterized membrane protein YdjX (TVP38/TMEM64 family)